MPSRDKHGVGHAFHMCHRDRGAPPWDICLPPPTPPKRALVPCELSRSISAGAFHPTCLIPAQSIFIQGCANVPRSQTTRDLMFCRPISRPFISSRPALLSQLRRPYNSIFIFIFLFLILFFILFQLIICHLVCLTESLTVPFLDLATTHGSWALTPASRVSGVGGASPPY